MPIKLMSNIRIHFSKYLWCSSILTDDQQNTIKGKHKKLNTKINRYNYWVNVAHRLNWETHWSYKDT